MTLWSVANVSVLGRDHAALRRNRQDASASGCAGQGVYGVVSDGCGQGRASEVGAHATVAIASAAIERSLRDGGPLEGLGERVLATVIDGLRLVAEAVPAGALRDAFVRDQLLATLVGFVVRDDVACVFAVGDGAFFVDGDIEVLDEDNRPSYPAYALAGAKVRVVERTYRGAALVVVATDGVDERVLRRAAAVDAQASRLSRALLLLQRAGALSDDGSVALARKVAP
ncbi:MAG: hypothetical protein HOW73_21810 [Polyangiaceae bacterium]|nr:hypothetical protein [Polyangiaceae bacterium]